MALADNQKQETVQKFSGEIKKPTPKFFPASDDSFDGNVNSRHNLAWVSSSVPTCYTKSYGDTRRTGSENSATGGNLFDDYLRVSIAENGRSGFIKSDPVHGDIVYGDYANNIE